MLKVDRPFLHMSIDVYVFEFARLSGRACGVEVMYILTSSLVPRAHSAIMLTAGGMAKHGGIIGIISTKQRVHYNGHMFASARSDAAHAS